MVTSIDAKVLARNQARANANGTVVKKEELPDISNVETQVFLTGNLWKFNKHWLSMQKNKKRSYTPLVDHLAPEAVTNTLLGIPGGSHLLQLEQKYLSSLQPSVRLFNYEGEEIRFENYESEASMTQSRHARGFGAGLKAVDIEMKGDSIASANASLLVKVQIYLASMEELFRERQGIHGRYKYSDLISRPPQPKNVDKCSDLPPDFDHKKLSIRLQYGYADIAKNKHWESAPAPLKDSIRACKRTLSLTLYKHTVEFQENGSIVLNIEYIGSIDRSLSQIDILELGMSPSERQTLRDHEHELCKATQPQPSAQKSMTKKQAEKEAKYHETLRKKVTTARKDGYSSFIRKLFDNKEIHRLAVTREDIDLSARGWLKLKNNVAVTKVKSETSSRLEAARKAAKKKKKSDKLTEQESGIFVLDYFYFGDLMNHVLDLATSEPSLERSHFVLGTFHHYLTGKDPMIMNGYPIASVPISMDNFSSWFLENVIKKGERANYNLMDFMIDILRGLLAPSFSPRAASGTSAAQTNANYATPIFAAHTFMSAKKPATHITTSKAVEMTSGINPPTAHGTEYVNYYIHGGTTSTVTQQRPQQKKADEQSGIYHLATGVTRGLVKSVKFKQAQQKYASEVRLQKNGHSSIQAVMWGMYNSTVELVGCPLFKPGMLVKVYSTEFNQEDANKIGLGGYYRILSVNSSIKEGKYSTTIECQWERQG